MNLPYLIEYGKRYGRRQEFLALRQSYEPEDTAALNRRVLLLPPMSARERARYLAYSYEGARRSGLGKMPHHISGETTEIRVTGPKDYRAAYRIDPIAWTDEEIATIPLSGELADLLGGQSYRMHRVKLESPWRPVDKLPARRQWFGYAPTDPFPASLTFEQERRAESLLATVLNPLEIGIKRVMQNEVGESQAWGRMRTVGRRTVKEQEVLRRSGQLILPHGWRFAIARKVEER